MNRAERALQSVIWDQFPNAQHELFSTPWTCPGAQAFQTNPPSYLEF